MNNQIKKKDKLIVALDFANFDDAKKMVEILDDEVSFYKIGLEMIMSGDYFKMIEFLKNKNKKIFADLKIYDIVQTVAKSIRNLKQFDIDLLTIHSANQGIMEAASFEKGNMKILAVTVLTCLEKSDLDKMGFDKNLSLEELVVKKADLSIKSGLDGVIASGLEAKILRNNLGDNFLIATPGIRIEKNNDDQKRVCDAKTAIANGANYLVVGRPITQSKDPKQSVKILQEMI